MCAALFRDGKKAIKRLLGIKRSGKQIKKIYEEEDYLEAYSQHTDLRVEEDPKSAIGGKWEELGKLQFEFLLDKGMQAHHRMLDIGCGTIRGGQHFIDYLDAGNYWGTDISPKAIEVARDIVQQKALSDKNPRLLVSEKKDLKFNEFKGEIFDFILAQSVFTHLKPEHISECFEHIGRVMDEKSAFYFTFYESDEYTQNGVKDFSYPFSYFESLADQYGFEVRNLSEEYKHPSGQSMARLTKA